jgi:mannose-6-phosphate isomerase-like protein (cupin superfamily)
MDKVNFAQKLGLFDALWSPKIVGELNGQHVKLVKVRGEFTWHHHDDEDELFIVPRGVEHKPVAEEEVHILLLEPVTLTRNTGNVENDLTADEQPWI